jgi:flagellin
VSDLNISALTDSTADTTKLEAFIKGVDAALSKMTTAASTVGAVQKRIDLQKTFVQNLSDAIDKGVGALVDADMNQESTRLQALQVQQQLGIQALSIANGSAQSIMSLFRG